MRPHYHAGIFGLLLSLNAAAVGTLEIVDGEKVSGRGAIGGWDCDSDQIDIEIDGVAYAKAASKGARPDTAVICGDTDNGFATSINWASLGDGAHTIRALGDGVEIGTATVVVTTFGAPFLAGASGTFTLEDFPESGTSTTVQWDEYLQNFVIVRAAGQAITVAPTSGLVTSETGTSADFTIVLDTEPTADVSVSLSSLDESEGTVSPATLTFTSSNWSTPQTVTVTGVRDAVIDGDVAYAIFIAPAVSADAGYHGIKPENVSVTNTDHVPPEQLLVAHYYGRILDRDSDLGGATFWDAEITRLRSLGVESKEAFIVMAVYFFNSAEYLARNTDDATFVGHLYRTFFNRDADQGGLDYWLGQIAAGMPRDIVMFNFLFSTEFGSYMAASLVDDPSRAEVLAVIDFYRGILNRIPETEGLDSWIGQFREAQCSVDNVLQAVKDKANDISWAFLNGSEYAGRNRTNAQYVSDLYNAFMRRGGDLGGVQYWINQLDTGARTRGELRQVFIDSLEFGARLQAVVNAGCLQ